MSIMAKLRQLPSEKSSYPAIGGHISLQHSKSNPGVQSSISESCKSNKNSTVPMLSVSHCDDGSSHEESRPK
jgi:hypothetical protein